MTVPFDNYETKPGRPEPGSARGTTKGPGPYLFSP